MSDEFKKPHIENCPNFKAIAEWEKFIPMPRHVIHCNEIEPGGRVLYMEILLLIMEKGVCDKPNSYFTDLYNCSERSISRWIKSLCLHRFILIENPGKITRKIYINDADFEVKNDIS